MYIYVCVYIYIYILLIHDTQGAPGMPEMLSPGAALVGAGLGAFVPLVTDGRFSGPLISFLFIFKQGIFLLLSGRQGHLFGL
jgi:hypothetical protein